MKGQAGKSPTIDLQIIHEAKKNSRRKFKKYIELSENGSSKSQNLVTTLLMKNKLQHLMLTLEERKKS